MQAYLKHPILNGAAMSSNRSETHAAFADTLAQAGRRLRTAFDSRVSQRGLTFGRARALRILSDGRLRTQTELAAEMVLESATLVRLLDGMVRLGLVERIEVPGDRRARHVALTPHGVAEANEVSRIATELRSDILADVPERDLEVALGVLRTVCHRLDEVCRDAR